MRISPTVRVNAMAAGIEFSLEICESEDSKAFTARFKTPIFATFEGRATSLKIVTS